MIVATLPPLGDLAAARAPAKTPEQGEWLVDWTIDDMWGVHPRPAQPIGYGRRHGERAAIADVDLQFG